jgi:hypothetical protein
MKPICIVYRFVMITVVSYPLRDGISSYLKRIDMFVRWSKAIKVFYHYFLFILLNQMTACRPAVYLADTIFIKYRLINITNFHADFHTFECWAVFIIL